MSIYTKIFYYHCRWQISVIGFFIRLFKKKIIFQSLCSIIQKKLPNQKFFWQLLIQWCLNDASLKQTKHFWFAPHLTTKKTCLRKAALYKHLHFGPLVLFIWLIYTCCRWCRWVVIYTKADYKIWGKINPSPIWDESVFRFKSFFCLTSTTFWVVDGFWLSVSMLYYLVSFFLSFFVCVWRNACAYFPLPHCLQ